MLVSLILVFREAMEAGLIVGIVLAATEGVRARGRWVAGGVGCVLRRQGVAPQPGSDGAFARWPRAHLSR